MPVAIGGRGVEVFDAQGKSYIDASGGAAVCCLGHGHPDIGAAMKAQIDKLAYVHSSFFTTDAAEALADRLVADAPDGLSHVYFVSGGSEAMEAAMKLARQYFVETGEPERLGVCFDTCHAHAGGYDLSTTAGAEDALSAFEKAVGLKWIRVLHLNDSKGKAGSRLDRHEHIGKGTIGLAGFGVVVRRAEFANVPKILETPKGEPGTKPNHDALNLRRLWRLRDEGSIKQPKQAFFLYSYTHTLHDKN